MFGRMRERQVGIAARLAERCEWLRPFCWWQRRVRPQRVTLDSDEARADDGRDGYAHAACDGVAEADPAGERRERSGP